MTMLTSKGNENNSFRSTHDCWKSDISTNAELWCWKQLRDWKPGNVDGKSYPVIRYCKYLHIYIFNIYIYIYSVVEIPLSQMVKDLWSMNMSLNIEVVWECRKNSENICSELYLFLPSTRYSIWTCILPALYLNVQPSSPPLAQKWSGRSVCSRWPGDMQ